MFETVLAQRGEDQGKCQRGPDPSEDYLVYRGPSKGNLFPREDYPVYTVPCKGYSVHRGSQRRNVNQ